MHLLIDGDLLIYRAGFAMEAAQHRQWLSEDEYEFPPVSHHIQALRMCLESILKNPRLGMTSYQIYLTSNDKSNFRFGLAKTQPYKGKRGKKPVFYHNLRSFLIKFYKAQVVEGQEADDAMGIAQTINSIVVSTDKDMLTIPGTNYNFITDELRFITQDEAKYNFYYQMLVGDTADNVLGVKGIGPVKAKKILDEFYGKDTFNEQAAFDKVLMLYDDAERFLESGRLLKIRQQPNEIWMGGSNAELLQERLEQLKD